MLREEVGRSYKTTLPPDDSMFNWRKVDGINIDISPDAGHNCWRVSIEKEDGSKIIKAFSDENEAIMFSRLEAEKVHRKNQSKKDYPANAIKYFPEIEKE
jgi:hypothetical protein